MLPESPTLIRPMSPQTVNVLPSHVGPVHCDDEDERSTKYMNRDTMA